MLGLTPDQARERYDAIIDFAELREFQDLKLKNYSSGMQVRLAFAVMVHVDADLLLIDEVLAVGDAAFQQKCYDVLHRPAARRAHDPARDARHGPGPALLRPGDAARARRLVPIGDAARGRPPLHRAQLRAAAELDGGGPDEAGAGGGRARDDRRVLGAGRRGHANRGARAGRLRARCACACASSPRPSTRCSSSPSATRTAARSSPPARSGTSPPARSTPGETLDVALSFDNWFAPGRYGLGGESSTPAPAAGSSPSRTRRRASSSPARAAAAASSTSRTRSPTSARRAAGAPDA